MPYKPKELTDDQYLAQREQLSRVMGCIEVPCLHCNAISLMQEYHHSLLMIVPGHYYLTCPKCHKKMELSFTFDKIEKESGESFSKNEEEEEKEEDF